MENNDDKLENIELSTDDKSTEETNSESEQNRDDAIFSNMMTPEEIEALFASANSNKSSEETAANILAESMDIDTDSNSVDESVSIDELLKDIESIESGESALESKQRALEEEERIIDAEINALISEPDESFAQDTVSADITEAVPAANANEKFSQDDIDALLAGMGGTSQTVAESEEAAESEESVVAEEALEESNPEAVPTANANEKFSQDDIDALLAGMGGTSQTIAESEEAAESEKSVVAEAALAESNPEAVPTANANEKFSQDDIDALLASAEAATAEEPVAADSSVVSDDLNELLGDIAKSDNSEDVPNELLNDLNTNFNIPDSNESLNSLSQDEIENLINSAGASRNNDAMEIDLADMEAMEKELGIVDRSKDNKPMSESDELAEIGNLLKMDSNSDESDDMLDMLTHAVEEQEEAGHSDEVDENTESDGESEEAHPNSKKKKKEKKTKSEKSSDKKDKKKNKVNKFVEFITASDDEDENSDNAADNTSVVGASEENQQILNELDAEGDEPSKGKKKKKKKGDKSSKAEKDGNAEGDEDAEKPAKKQKKPKKEKTLKEEPSEPQKRLNKKNVVKIFILAFTLLGGILLVVIVLPKKITSKETRNAFYRGDYDTVYTDFFGEKLSDSDRIMFEKAEIMLKLTSKYDGYVNFSNMNMPAEALDQLLIAVDRYEEWALLAQKRQMKDEFEREYADILQILNEKYGLSEEDAKRILDLPTDLEYSLMVEAIANGTEYIDPNKPLPGPFIPPVSDKKPQYEDLLPEEE